MLPPPERATAVELSDADSNNVIAGGVTTANFPHEARNLRRSSLKEFVSVFSGVIFFSLNCCSDFNLVVLALLLRDIPGLNEAD